MGILVLCRKHQRPTALILIFLERPWIQPWKEKRKEEKKKPPCACFIFVLALVVDANFYNYVYF
jgi:hypothetical protein